MYNRRQFLGAIGLPAVGAIASPALIPSNFAKVFESASSLDNSGVSAAAVAQDEQFWFEVQQAFSSDRTLVNLNYGGVSASPIVVQDAMKQYLDYSNTAPVYSMWKILEPQREGVRERMARVFGCDTEEIAFTRNASESLEICQLGFDLRAGDEILTTNQDYGRMVTTFKQRERREGVVLKQFSIPVPAEDVDEIVSRFEQNITPRTRLILMCHMINLTGQILPVKQVVRMARGRNIPVIVDGAHAFAHFDFTHRDLDCDYYGSSLHKWLNAPHGTGLLYVRRDKIAGLWPMMAAPDRMDDDIRKFEEIGTHPAANYLAIGDALTFHIGIGPERKAARLRYLRNYWAERLLAHDRVRLHTSLKPQFACGLANVQVEGIDSSALGNYMWKRHRIIVTPIKHAEFEGLRVTPNICTTLEELDRFCDAMEEVIRHGLPAD
ncbi:MAG: aminotransferase class V-fold PLP-dependent enzyme [Acidobacteriota bacterium]